MLSIHALLRRRLAAIALHHATAGLETPTEHPLVREMLRRYARSRGTAVKKKDALHLRQSNIAQIVT